MVLEGSSSPTEAFASDAPPSSDIDPYSNRNPPFTSTRQPSFTSVAKDGNERIYINLANLPRPFSFFGTRAHPPPLIESIQDSCRFAQQVLKRPPRQEEADAFAFHAAKTYRIASFGSPIGIALSSVQFYRTRETFRFPGWTPFTEGGWLSADRLGPLKGQMARYAWHSMRLSAYWALGSVVGSVFFGSYAVSVSLAGRAMDPRLKDFSDKLRELQKEGVSMKSIRRAQDADSTTQEETFEQRRQRRGVQGMNRENTKSSGNDYDDISPTGGSFGAEFLDPPSDTGLLNDDQMRQQETKQQADPRSISAENTLSPFDMNSAAPQSVTPSRQPPKQTSQEGKSSGSAWERLRQQSSNRGDNGNNISTRALPSANSAMPSKAKGEQRQGSTLGDSFSFSESEEERQLAKAEAQKDFDARIEREREGRDFEDTGRGRRAW